MFSEQSYESVKPARSAQRILIMTVTAALALYAVVCGALFASQRSLIYYPQPRLNTEGSVLMTLSVGAAQVHVSTYPHAGPAALIYFGGNAEDVSQDVPDLVNAFPNTAIYALHYPGYGGSSGTPTQQAIFADSLALFDRVKADHPNATVVGRSLGSGVAVWIASQRPISRLVLVTPFDSLGDAAAPQYRFLPVRWLLRDRFESWRYAPEVTAPTRIIVAGDDELVPRSSSDRLRTRFREGLVSYVVVPGFGHNTIQDSPGYWTLLSTG
jgi:pimeloyl-ACP methyl ester carboxylesterase